MWRRVEELLRRIERGRPVEAREIDQVVENLRLGGAPANVVEAVAALEQVVDASVEATMPGQNGADVAIKMTVKGNGTTDWDVKGAIVKASRMTTQINGTFSSAGMGAMEMTGTTIVNLERVP